MLSVSESMSELKNNLLPLEPELGDHSHQALAILAKHYDTLFLQQIN